MMRKTLIALALGSLSLSLTTQAEDRNLEPHAIEAKEIIQGFFTQLKSELVGAMQAGGPRNAVEVCQLRARVITQQAGETSGWQVGRTSLQPRNPANAPDAWEQDVLETFEQRKAAGEPVDKLVHMEVIEGDGGASFRLMKAIPTGEVCLKCHGEQIPGDVVEYLDQFYPEDQARGYQLGDIRGAFTLQKAL